MTKQKKIDAAWKEYMHKKKSSWVKLLHVVDVSYAEYKLTVANAREVHLRTGIPDSIGYRRFVRLARAEHKRIKGLARAEYRRIVKLARAEYKCIADGKSIAEPAHDEAVTINTQEKVKPTKQDKIDAAYAEYLRLDDVAWPEYERAMNPAWAEYERIRCEEADD